MSLLEALSGQPIWLAVVISLGVSIFVAIAGIIPSAFVTAANIVYFGFVWGLLLSILGEAVGAVLSFILYRKGIKKLKGNTTGTKRTVKILERLKQTRGFEAFLLVILLRLFPFAPSGLVTLAASYSMMGTWSFTASSTLGKIPALLIEAYSVHTVLGWETEYQLAAATFAALAGISYFYWTTRK
jgi:uncharacterized membrane protein YdjX (TVP38/TMEM64 family)